MLTGNTKSYVIKGVTLAKIPRLFGCVSSITHEDFEPNGLEVSSCRRALRSFKVVCCAILHGTKTENFCLHSILLQVCIKEKVAKQRECLPYSYSFFKSPHKISILRGIFILPCMDIFIHIFSPLNYYSLV